MTSVYVHALDGRIRVKVTRIKGSPEKALDLENALRQRDGIDVATANPLTGNVLVLYDPRRTTQLAVMAALEQLGWRDHERTRNVSTATLAAEGVGHKLVENAISTVLECAFRGLVTALV